MWKCKYCLKEFIFDNPSQKANHSRWCELNPERKQYVFNLHLVRSKITKEQIQKRANGIKKAWKNGNYAHVNHATFKGKHHTKESIEKIRQGALNSNHRRLKKNTIKYKGVTLDSSWELALAKRLDNLKIKWIRPLPLKWKDKKGCYHNYFPDFYLPEFNVYLDPKNTFAFNVQKEKINILKNTYSNIIFLKDLKECEEFEI